MAVSIKSEPVEGGRGLNKEQVCHSISSIFLAESSTLPPDIDTT